MQTAWEHSQTLLMSLWSHGHISKVLSPQALLRCVDVGGDSLGGVGVLGAYCECTPITGDSGF